MKDGEPQFKEVYGEVTSDSVASGAELLALPMGSVAFSWKKATAQESYEFLKSLPAVQTFALNKETVETVFKIDDSKTEYYTVNCPTDLVGTKIPYYDVYLQIGDTLLSHRSTWQKSITLPKLADGQRVIVRPSSTKDISESLKYLGTYCAEWILDDLSPHEKSFQFAYQYKFEFILKDKDGNEHDGARMSLFDEVKQFLKTGLKSYTIKDPLSFHYHTFTVFGAWVGSADDTLSRMYSYWNGISEEKNVARYEFDTTVVHPEPIVLTAEYEPIYRISRITGELDTNIKSVKQQADGSYLVRFTQNGANGYQSLIRLPAGAYDITLDGENQASGELSLAEGKNTHNISFRISEADLKADNRILCHIITPQGNRSLQFIREIENTVFTYSMPTQVSSNEVMFNKRLTESGSAHLLGYGTTQPAHSIFYYTLGTTFGAYWGLERHVYADPFSRKTTSTEYDRLDPTKSYYKPDYSAEDYKNAEYTAFSNGSSYKSFECKWVTFKSTTNDFAVALNVDGAVTYLDTQYIKVVYYNRSLRMRTKSQSVGFTSSFASTYDAENQCYWLSSEFLAEYGLYDKSTGIGFLPIPMSEPESYPHTYKAELKYKHKNGAGETVMQEVSHDIRLYYDAPVLQKWNYEHFENHYVQTSPMHYATITNREDRIAYANQTNRYFALDWNGTDIFTFRAWFDKPKEVYNVYAVADVPESCKNFAIKLEYDEELGCYTGTGLLGDALNPPKEFNIVYELVAARPYEGMPTMQIKDLAKTYASSKDRADKGDNGLPEGWTMETVAPTNGWTLEETYRIWAEYEKLVLSGNKITDDDLKALLGDEMKLYYPAYNIYNEKGELLGTIQNYFIFGGVKNTDGEYSVAIMNGNEYLGKVTNGFAVNKDKGIISMYTTSDNYELLLPEFGEESVSAAGIPAVVAKAASAIGGAIGSVGQLAASSPVVSAASDFFTVKGTADVLNAAHGDYIGNKDWMKYLTNEQRQDYLDMKSDSYLYTAIETAAGMAHPLAGVAFGLFDIWRGNMESDIEAKYKEIARLNRENIRLKEKLEWEEFKERWRTEMEEHERALVLIITYGWDGTTFPRNAELPYELSYHIDPSGYIFEGIEGNLLEGVRATVYYLDTASGEWVQWDSEAHGEGPNPNISGADGKYGWDVLIGKWKVVFEKDGYYTVESIELDVPPAHLDVNMSMVSTSPAMLKEVRAGARGAYIDFTFDRPVLVDDAKRLISVMFGGNALDGNTEALNAALTAFGNKQKAGEHDVTVGQNVATKFRFTPEDPIEVGASVKVVGEKGILTYNGIEMAAFESGYVLVPETVADPITALSYSGIKEIEIGATLDLMSDLTITGSEGTLTFKAKTPTVATVDENGVVTALSGGMAYFEISCGTVRTMAAVSVKEAPHTHSFTEEFPLMEYLASEATCTEPAKYYRFCSCGIVGTETFSHGEAKGHNFGEWTLNLADNTCERTCSVCGDVEKDNSISLLSVSGKTAKAGDTVSVTISLANNPGIAALAFRVSYPKGAMKLESAVAGGLFGSATLNTSTGMFLFDNAADVTENGTLLTLTFKVSDMAALGEYRISLEIVSCNNAAEERVVICGGQANIEVSDILSGDANGDGTVDTLDITRLRRYLAEESVDLFPGADMNGDGAVDIEDLTCLRRYLVEAGAGLGE